MIAPLCIALAAHFPASGEVTRPIAADPEKLTREYVSAVQKLNEAQARKSEAKTEEDLAKKLPQTATRALDDLLALEKGSELAAALAQTAEASLDLSKLDDFEKIRLRLEKLDPAAAKTIGEAIEAMSAAEKGIRINRVRYYRFKDFEEALIATEKGEMKRKDVEKLFR